MEPDEAQPRLRVPRDVLGEIFAHAREAVPDECCGLVTGRRAERFRRAHRCRNDASLRHQEDPERWPRDATRAFLMNETDYLTVWKAAEERGEQVTAIYHSHVGAGAWFSELDQEFAGGEFFPFPEADHLVVSVVDGVVKEAALFRRDADGRFGGRWIEAEEG